MLYFLVLSVAAIPSPTNPIISGGSNVGRLAMQMAKLIGMKTIITIALQH